MDASPDARRTHVELVQPPPDPTRGRNGPRAAPRLEVLEGREVPAVLIQVDYSYDTGFFSNPDARAVMEQAAAELGNSISSNLTAIVPAGGNTWTATFFNPVTGAQATIPNMTVGANTIKVFVGGRALGGGEAGSASTSGNSVSGSADWVRGVMSRNWGGSIAFDTNRNWYFGQTTAGLTANKLDFYSVATHELGHVLGIGTSNAWNSLSSGGYFRGGNAAAVYGGAVPLAPDGIHWADGLTLSGQAISLDPSIAYGQRVNWTSLDAAALRDLGWGAAASASTAAAGPALNPQLVAVSAGGAVSLVAAAGGTLASTGARFTPFAGYTGEVRVAAGDFNGDGVADYAVATGAGVAGTVAVISGTGGYLVAPQNPFGGFAGGLSIAATDINHDGRAELVIGRGAGAPPLVRTYQIGGGGLQLQSSFIAFGAEWFRGGVRVAAGDLNRDGYGDVVVTSAVAVGAAVGYSGAGLRNGTATQLFAAFAPAASVPAGLNAAVGDVDGDGYADLALTFERGGPPVVAIWSGAVLTQNPATEATNLPVMGAFYAFAGNDTSGVRLALKDVDGDGRADVVASSGNSLNSQVRVFNFAPGRSGAVAATPLGVATVSGIYVG